MDDKALGAWLKEIRKRAPGRPSQAEVARRLRERHPDLDLGAAHKAHQVWVSRKESGEGLDLAIAEKIAGVLGYALVVNLVPADPSERDVLEQLPRALGKLDHTTRRWLLTIARAWPLLDPGYRELVEMVAEKAAGRLASNERGPQP